MTEQTRRPSPKDTDATPATRAKTPSKTLKPAKGEPGAAPQASMGEALDRATAAVGADDGKR